MWLYTYIYACFRWSFGSACFSPSLATSLELFMLSTPSPSEDPDLICCKHPHPIKLFLSLCFCKFKGLWSIFICENKRFVIHYYDRYLFFFSILLKKMMCWSGIERIYVLIVGELQDIYDLCMWYSYICMYVYVHGSIRNCGKIKYN